MQTSDYHILRIENSGENKLFAGFDQKTKQHSYAPVWQTEWWTHFLKITNSITDGYCVYHDNLEEFCFVQKRSLGMGQYGLFVLGGPIRKRKKEEGRRKKLNNIECALMQLCKNEKCLFVQLEPLEKYVQLHTKHFKLNTCYKRFIEPTTALIDLSQSEDEILAHMKSKGRYNIRLGAKHDISIYKDNSPQAVEEFYKLLTQTTQRNNFSGNTQQYYLDLCKILGKKDIGGLYLAKKGEEIIAGSIFVFYGNVGTYYYGASTNDNTMRKYMASYALQWEAIKEAKKRGCSVFDFLGIATPGDTKSHLTGVTDFKMKFGPDVHTWPQAQMYVSKPFYYKIFLMIRRIKSLIK